MFHEIYEKEYRNIKICDMIKIVIVPCHKSRRPLLKFEWDELKNQLNRKKHGIDFETAILVFNDLQRIEIYDEEHSITEDRYNTIGLVDDVLFVVYTERKESIRLISARVATPKERSIYYDENSYIK